MISLGSTPWLAFILCAAAAASAEGRGCAAPGCPLVPVDILDERAKVALEALRNEDASYVRSELAPAGGENGVTLTLKGFKGGHPNDQVNQDSSTILSPLVLEEKYKNCGKTCQLVGVFDGHGKLGEVTSAHAAKDIPKRLVQKLKQLDSGPSDACYDYKEADIVAALKEAFVEADKADPTGGIGGATATLILQLGPKLYIANAGDSRSFLGVWVAGAFQEIVYESREDKPDLPEERQRILEAGGYVHIPPNPHEDVPRAYYIDSEGRARYGLAMSRSIGDWSVQGVIAEPLVDVLNVASIVQTAIVRHSQRHCPDVDNEEKKVDDGCSIDTDEVHLVAISASDGMMDFLDPSWIAQVMGGSFFAEPHEKEDHRRHPFVSAEALILEAAHGWDSTYGGEYRDDIVIAALPVSLTPQLLAAGKRALDEEHDEL